MRIGRRIWSCSKRPWRPRCRNSPPQWVWRTAYTDGVLSARTKHLMAMGLALGTGCRNCVLAQAERALQHGATKNEFLEALAVVVSMRGATGIAESLRVVQYLDEKGAW